MSLLERLRGKGSDAGVEPESGETVEGERSTSAAQLPPSLQSRLTNLLALGLMGAIGAGMLGWYYVRWIHARSTARTTAISTAQGKAEGEINLRPLGRVDPPSMVASLLGDAPEEPPLDIPTAPLRSAGRPDLAAVGYTPASGVANKNPQELLRERLLSGAVFSSGSPATAAIPDRDLAAAGEQQTGDAELSALLKPTATEAARAQVLPTRQLLMPKGAFLDCTLETAIDSTLPGMTTCILATDAFSADGSVVLLERGTKLIGETRGQVRQGAARVFVLWTEARTPKGVVVPLASPGTDELGRSGLPGEVNRHFFERFGAAILVSVIDGAIQTAVASQREGGSTVVVDPSATQDIMTEVLRGTINIPPTVVKPQGDRIQVLVARDLDFRSVYELRPVSR